MKQPSNSSSPTLQRSIHFQKTTLLERIARRVAQEWEIIWKLVLAVVAIADVLGCWPVFVEGWNSAVSQRKSNLGTSSLATWDFLKKPKHGTDDWAAENACAAYDADDDYDYDSLTCATYSLYYDMLGTARYLFHWMGPLFCFLCILEAVRRAQQAREDMLEMAALDQFEKKLARLYGSTRRLSINSASVPQHAIQHEHHSTPSHQSSSLEEETTYEQDDILARRTLRFWTPVLSTLFLWSLLLPWSNLLNTDCGSEVDTALATLWITQALGQLNATASWMMDELTTIAWNLLLPFSFWQPHKIYLRILTLLRWVRYFRFAGPLLRVLFKLNDQFLVFFKTKQQAWQLKAEKTKRELRRSMLFEDIRKVESFTKLSGFWAKVPTWQIFQAAKETPLAEVGGLLKDKKKQSTKLKRQLDDLKAQVGKSPKAFPTSEIYDRIADLSKEFTSTVGSTLWSANLILPQTRFSLSWRVIVTCALLSEVSRICTSYQLYGRVNVSYTAMMGSVLGCASDRGGNILTATGRLTRKIVRKLVKFPKEQLLSTCTTASIKAHGGGMANFLLYFSSAFETTIDLVCFIDIYVWFFTGELDLNGQVVPKPFFYRCILPGTLVQVLDHPTVPDVLPNILFFSLSASGAVGYSRMIRWLVAIVPAVNVLLVDPIKSFLFRPMEEDEWLKYTESMAVLPVLSGADIRYAMNMSHPNFGDFQYQQPTLRRSVTIERNVNLSQPKSPQNGPIRRTKTNSPLRTTPKLKSFVPLVPSMGELQRGESSSAGLNLDSFHESATFNLDGSQPFNMSIDQAPTLQEVMMQQSPNQDFSRLIASNKGIDSHYPHAPTSPRPKYTPQKDILTIESVGDLSLDSSGADSM